MGLFDKLKKAAAKTRKILSTDVRDLFKKGQIMDEEMLERIERSMISTDMGVEAAGEVVEDLREKFLGRKVFEDELMSTIQADVQQMLEGSGDVQYDLSDQLSPLNLNSSGPTVILVAGVNGVGKTTSIAKLANFLKSQGKSVVLAAGDTFRAAAVEQLTMWSKRLGCEIVTKPSGADPASVAYEGCEVVQNTNADVLLVDTAGRLQTQKNLMDELGKVKRVIGNQIEGAPHESLLVIDATTGQNGLSQAENFSQAVECTGIVLAKLDGTAKGGVVVAIRRRMGIPVKYVGVGEGIDDLELFDPVAFAKALFFAE